VDKCGGEAAVVSYRTRFTSPSITKNFASHANSTARWEQGKREQTEAFLGRVKRFLQDADLPNARRVGYWSERWPIRTDDKCERVGDNAWI
jgi:hypothetical protein